MGACCSAYTPQGGIISGKRKNSGTDPKFEDLEMFNIPKDIIYLDSASHTLKHRGSVDQAKVALDESMQVWK